MISNRVVKLQNLSAIRGKTAKESHFERDYHYSALNIFNNLSHWEKLAKSMAYAISNMDVWAYQEDGIGGRIYYTKEMPIEQKCPELDFVFPALDKIKQTVENFDELIDNQLVCMLFNGNYLSCNGHIAWNYEKILSLGVDGLKEQFLQALQNAKDEKAKEFYSGVVILLDSLLEFNDKHIKYYQNLGNYELAELMSQVPRKPCKTFRQAVQAFFMQYLVVMRENPFGGNSPGRLDYYLWPYLKRDLENKIITLDEAKELIDELFLRIDERIYEIDVWAETIVVGGTDDKGNSAVNPLTYIMIESIMDLNVTHPSLYIRLPKNPPQELLEISARYLNSGNNRAQILNDASIMDALIKNKTDPKDAYNYVCGGCMEIGIQGKNCDFLFGGWINTAKMVELLISGGICLHTNKIVKDFTFKKGLVGYTDFDTFYSDYLSIAKKYILLSFYMTETYNQLAEINRPSYLLSSMIDNCLQMGRNLNAGGAKYHNYGFTPLALPDAIDNLYAVKYAVFDKKICSAEELVNALKCNFKGYENLQSKLKAIPKYGVDDKQVDTFANKVVSDIVDIFHSYKTRFGGMGKAIILTFLYAPIASSILGARADGKNANASVAQGLTPNSSSMVNGITSAINSCTCLPFDKLSGGASTMWDFDSTWANEQIIMAVLKTFVEKNGQIFQGNSTSVEDLIKAQSNPQDYANLIVRVGGFSARFIYLAKEVQNEIINRIRHNG